jgi:hypothetical protein
MPRPGIKAVTVLRWIQANGLTSDQAGATFGLRRRPTGSSRGRPLNRRLLALSDQ